MMLNRIKLLAEYRKKTKKTIINHNTGVSRVSKFKGAFGILEGQYSWKIRLKKN